MEHFEEALKKILDICKDVSELDSSSSWEEALAVDTEITEILSICHEVLFPEEVL